MATMDEEVALYKAIEDVIVGKHHIVVVGLSDEIVDVVVAAGWGPIPADVDRYDVGDGPWVAGTERTDVQL